MAGILEREVGLRARANSSPKHAESLNTMGKRIVFKMLETVWMSCNMLCEMSCITVDFVLPSACLLGSWRWRLVQRR